MNNKKIYFSLLILSVSSSMVWAQKIPQPCDCQMSSPSQNQNSIYDQNQSNTNPGEYEVIIQSKPAQDFAKNSGSPPLFKILDTNNNGLISESEASAYPPLANDFLYVSHNKPYINKKTYNHWSSESYQSKEYSQP